MEQFVALWPAILLSAVLVFIVSSLMHMFVPIHKGDHERLPDPIGLAACRGKKGDRVGGRGDLDIVRDVAGLVKDQGEHMAARQKHDILFCQINEGFVAPARSGERPGHILTVEQDPAVGRGT